jgi:hypothetical protein
MNDKGCPCTYNCCDNPEVITPEHDHNENDNDFCILCWTSECLNCGESCECNV